MPQYDGLATTQILEQYKDHSELFKHLPEKAEQVKLPKQFVINLIYTLIGDDFEIFIRSKINERNDKLQEDRNLMISVDPQIAKIFYASNFVSCK